MEQYIMQTLDQVIEGLTTATGDLDLISRFSVVDANEVAAALADVDADSAEGVVLRLLSKYNPVVTFVAPITQIVVDANSEEA
jgi:predicted oxidoreductase